MSARRALAGVMAALVTPAGEDGEPDIAGLERLVSRVVTGGADGISPAGSTGEGPRLTREQRLAVTRRVRALVPPGMPVIPGVPLSTPQDGMAELEALAGAGATAALVSPPSYYPLSDDAVQRLYETLAARSPLPLLLYNIPVFTKVRIAPGVVAKLAAHPSIAGIKDSSRDLEYQQQVIHCSAGTEFSVFTGTDTLLVASLTIGAAGAIAASVNLVPDLTAGVYRAVTTGDLTAALRMQERLARVVAACRRGEFPAGWKTALELAGVCAAHPVPPGLPLSAEQRSRLAADLAAEGIA
ncbi:MAG TPA: dihydrodipicolinate synthase family protein [Streptosporangiaceae bacterium]|nr:dihydrodipicolinate synthase family protein [Streptosporangiaceae bacterium]